MLRLHARGGGRALNGVEAIHAAGGIFTPFRVVRDELVESRIGWAGKKVGIERDDDVRIAEVVLNVVTAGKERAGDGGIVLHQRGLRISGLNSLPLARKRRGGDGGGEKVDA